MRYIDTHAHVFPPAVAQKVIDALHSFYGIENMHGGTAEDLLTSMAEIGVEKCVVFAAATKPAQVVNTNNFLLDVQRRYPDKYLAFGTIHPDYEDCAGEIARIKAEGLHGLKIHPDFQKIHADSPEMMKIYGMLGEDFPVILHAGDKRFDYSGPQRIRNIIDAYPHLKVVAAHMGGYSEWENARKYLVGQNVYFDISSTFPYISVEEIREMILAHGTDKILFASDYPTERHGKMLEYAQSLNLPAEDMEKIFYKNALRFLNLK